MHLSTGWNSIYLCPHCHITKHDYVKVPNPLPNMPRRTLTDFMENATKPGMKSFLCDLFTFKPAHIKYCQMHSLNLGVSHVIIGGALKILSDELEVWGSKTRSETARLHDAYIAFHTWAKTHKVPYPAKNNKFRICCV